MTASRWAAGLCAAGLVLALASCASVPARTPAEWMGVLPSDASLYLSVFVPKSADLIRKTLKQGGPAYDDVVTLADRTDRAVLSVTLSPGAPTRFAAVALGNYPTFLINLSLSGKKEWKQVSTAQGNYYLWNKANVQLSVPGGGVLLAANGEMPTLLSRLKTPIPLPIPAEVQSDMLKTDVVLYMPQLPGGLGQTGGDLPVAMESDERTRLPVREVWVDATKTPEGYTLAATMNTGTEQQARVLSLLLRIAVVAWMKSSDAADVARRLKAISISPDGTMVRVKGVAVKDEEMIPLFLSLLKGPAAQAEPPQ